MGSLGKFLHRYFIPSHGNSYRPHILRRQSLVFFIAVIFITEGMFVSGLFIGQGGPAATASLAAVAATSDANTLAHSVERQLVRVLGDSRPAVPWVLGGIATLLAAAVLFAFFIHIQIQQPHMLFSGALVALFAISLLATNAHIVRAALW